MARSRRDPIETTSRGSRASRIALVIAAVFFLASISLSDRAAAWDSATHRAIARLAVQALPASALKSALASREFELENFSVEPDSVLKQRYGKAEERRHYLDVERFGDDPWPSLVPDLRTMRRRFGSRTLDESGTLPWTIEQVSGELESAWRRGDCASVLRLSGYLAHYVGDASQPLHTTIHFDGYARDRGVHARFERTVDAAIGTLAPQAASAVRIEPINDVWTPAIAEIRDAHGLFHQVIRDDRVARDQDAYGGPQYQRAMLREDGAMVAGQIARAASVLAELWLYEWRRAGSPSACGGVSRFSAQEDARSEQRLTGERVAMSRGFGGSVCRPGGSEIGAFMVIY